MLLQLLCHLILSVSKHLQVIHYCDSIGLAFQYMINKLLRINLKQLHSLVSCRWLGALLKAGRALLCTICHVFRTENDIIF